MAELMQLWGAEPLITVNDRNGPIETSILISQAEAYSCFVLSQLEIQNQSRDTLVFSSDAHERVQACIQEMQLCPTHERLFVWETAPVERKQQSFRELKLLAVMILILVLAGVYKTYY
jgi:hypothetical protein